MLTAFQYKAIDRADFYLKHVQEGTAAFQRGYLMLVLKELGITPRKFADALEYVYENVDHDKIAEAGQ